jgi:FkbM family methyltransferase
MSYSISVSQKDLPKNLEGFCIDEPLSQAVIIASSPLRVSGWVLAKDSREIKELFFRSANGERIEIEHGFFRPDVQTHFPNLPNSLNSGFYGYIAPERVFPGEMSLVIKNVNDQEVVLGEINAVEISTAQSPSSSSLVLKDQSSQHGEVSEITKLIKDDWPQYIADVGAHDGVYLSNSQPFVLANWRALLIEPMPKIFSRLNTVYQEFSNVTCLNIACSDYEGVGEIFIGNDGEFGQNSTLCKDQNSWFDATRSTSSIKVQVRRLTDVLIEQKFPKDFSVLLVDAEGMDYEVLLGLDFNQFQPRLILTEEYEINFEKNHRKHQFLMDQGYKFQARLGCNTLWLAKSCAV